MTHVMPWKVAKIVSVHEINPNVRSFILRNMDGSAFDFEAGQFITLDLPIHEKKSKRLRSYSIASPPYQKDTLEVIVSLANPSGGGSAYLFSQIDVDSELQYRGPMGTFVLPKTVEHDIVFVCTGTGITPFLSMVYDMLFAKKKLQYNFTIIFGCRNKADIIYYQQLLSLEKQFPNFSFIPTLSREKWDGHMGYVHEVYRSDSFFIHPNTHFYLCGWRQMVDEARNHLLAMGLHKSCIHFELYG